MGSSLTSFFLFDVGAYGIVFFLFFRLYVFCCICSTTFGTSKSFSFSSLYRNFLSVFDAIIFDISISVLISGQSHSLSNPNKFSQWSCGVSVSVFVAQKNLLVRCICFFSVRNICCIF